MFVRMFISAVDPGDVDEVRRIFHDDVDPALTDQPGCLGVELLVSVEKNAGGLVEGAAVSRWRTREELDRALDQREVQGSLVRVNQLLRQEPITKIFEVLDS